MLYFFVCGKARPFNITIADVVQFCHKPIKKILREVVFQQIGLYKEVFFPSIEKH
jgi:hypothetical protein